MRSKMSMILLWSLSVIFIFSIQMSIMEFDPIQLILFKIFAVCIMTYGVLNYYESIKSKLKAVIAEPVRFWCAICLSLILLGMINPSYYSKTESVELTISPIQVERNDSIYNEVWIKSITVDGILVDLHQVENEDWKVKYNRLYTSTDVPLSFSFDKVESMKIDFLKHSYSGAVEITSNDLVKSYDLYSDIENNQLVDYKYGSVKYWVYVVTYALLFVMVSILIDTALSWNVVNHGLQNSNKVFFKFFGITFAVWFVFNIIFLNGIISYDTLDQWGQVKTIVDGNPALRNWHPGFHTIAMYILSGFGTKITLIPFFYSLFYSLVWAWGASILHKENVKDKILVSVSVLIAIFPVNIMMLQHMWKDIPYAISLLLLTIVLYQIARNPSYIDSKKNRIILIGSALCVGFFRHNGIIPMFMTIIVLIGYYFLLDKSRLKRASVSSLAIVILFLFIKGPVYGIYNVEAEPGGLKYSFFMHQVAAVVKYDGNLTGEQKEKIENIVPLEYVKRHYWPYNHNGLCFASDPDFPGYSYVNSLTNNGFDIIKLYFQILPSNVDLYIKDILSLTNLMWDAFTPSDGYIYTIDVGDLTHHSVIADFRAQNGIEYYDNEIKTRIVYFHQFMDGGIAYQLVWRHSHYLFICLLAFSVLVIKKSYRQLIAFTPLVFNLLSLLISMIAQDYRYIFSTIVVMPFVVLISMSSKPQITK